MSSPSHRANFPGIGRVGVVAAVFLLGGFFSAGCSSTTVTPAAATARTTGALVEFRADGNVRNPAARDAFPGVRRISVRAVDQRSRPDAMLQITDRVSVPAGERTLLLAAESASGVLTLSEAKLRVEPGVDYVVWPRVTAEGAILAEIKRGPYGETLALSAPWTPPAEEAGR